MNIQNINIPKFTITKIPAISAPSFKSVNLERTPDDDKFELSIGYVNDLHGQTNNMMRILSGIKGDLILSGGDNDIGDEKNRPVHDATVKFLNLANIRGTALGNHEMDRMGTTRFHFHLEEWKYAPVNDVMEYFNTLVRIKR